LPPPPPSHTTRAPPPRPTPTPTPPTTPTTPSGISVTLIIECYTRFSSSGASDVYKRQIQK
ncbi:hypothetical protein, partial [Xylophilus sp. ASV27]|uniref:hypothetical protein n=1 Tax=Xylophilus sp. ASV27 TaxID=2795129 RepID=UPI0018EBBD3A